MLVEAEPFLNKIFFGALRPQKHDLTVSEWADQKRVLSSKASAEPGRWRTSRTPYLKEPMDCLSTSTAIERVILMWGAQLGKTESGNNFIGYTIDYAPVPLLMVQPTVDIAKRVSKQRIDPMIEECPSLREKIPPARARDSGNTVLQKDYPGATLMMTGANSAAGLRSMPVGNLFLDEVDAYPGDVDEEGDPVNLAIARTRTYRNRKILMTSTPTLKGSSRIEAEFEKSDQRRFEVPCPHCNEHQVLKFSNLKWDEGKPDTATYQCEECGTLIEEHHKTWMLDQGKWVPQYPEREIRGYHLSALYSPIGFFSWKDVVQLFLESKDKPDHLRTFVNTVLGETWEEQGESPDYEKLYRRRESYKTGTVPDGAYILTAGADVQKNRIEVKVEGWGRDLHRWSIDYETLEGNPDDSEVWQKLDRYLEKEFPHELGAKLQISRLAIDTGGHHTQMVYNWVRQQDVNRVMGIKGQDNLRMIVGRPTQVDMTLNGVKTYRALQIWNIGVSLIKSELFSFLKKDLPLEKDDPLPFGWCHFPEWDLDWFKGLCSEKLIYQKGKQLWKKIYERNEPLDNTVYARAAAYALGIDRWTDEDWDIVKSQIISDAKEVVKTPSKQPDRNWIQRDRDDWL